MDILLIFCFLDRYIEDCSLEVYIKLFLVVVLMLEYILVIQLRFFESSMNILNNIIDNIQWGISALFENWDIFWLRFFSCNSFLKHEYLALIILFLRSSSPFTCFSSHRRKRSNVSIRVVNYFYLGHNCFNPLWQPCHCTHDFIKKVLAKQKSTLIFYEINHTSLASLYIFWARS